MARECSSTRASQRAATSSAGDWAANSAVGVDGAAVGEEDDAVAEQIPALLRVRGADVRLAGFSRVGGRAWRGVLAHGRHLRQVGTRAGSFGHLDGARSVRTSARVGHRKPNFSDPAEQIAFVCTKAMVSYPEGSIKVANYLSKRLGAAGLKLVPQLLAKWQFYPSTAS